MIRLIFLLIVMTTCLPQFAFSQAEVVNNTHNKIAKSLVYLTVEGFDARGNIIRNSGTGFLISKNGIFITALHTISKTEERQHYHETVDSTLSTVARIGGKNANPRKAHILAKYPKQDIAIVSMDLDPTEITQSVCMSNDNDRKLKIGKYYYSSGFPHSLVYSVDEGKVQSGRSEKGYAINMRIDDGQSGSPVYDIDGFVAGILLGNEGNKTFAGSLHDRWSEIENYYDGNDCQSISVDDSNVIPAVFSVSLEAEVALEPIIENVIRQSDVFGVSTGSVVETKCREFSIAPSRGWKIDPVTARVITTSVRGSNSIVFNKRAEEELRIQYCARSTIRGLKKETGDAFGRIAYTEYREVDQRETKVIYSKSDSTGCAVVSLPQNTSRFEGLIQASSSNSIRFSDVGRYEQYQIDPIDGASTRSLKVCWVE